MNCFGKERVLVNVFVCMWTDKGKTTVVVSGTNNWYGEHLRWDGNLIVDGLVEQWLVGA